MLLWEGGDVPANPITEPASPAHTGYGIAPGYAPSWGEYIHFFADSTDTLEAGRVLSVEPPVLIHEEKLGAHVIDDVLVTDTGVEVLSRFARDLVIMEP